MEGEVCSELLTSAIALERGQFDRARAAADRALARTPKLRDRVRGAGRAAIQFVAGTAEARSGALAASRRRVDAHRTAVADANRVEAWWQHALDVEIALAAGVPADAAAALAAAPTTKMWFSNGYDSLRRLINTLPVHDTAARVRLGLGDRPGAIAAYRELLTPSRNQQRVVSLEPRFVLALARLLDATGDAAGARAEYERFAALWHGADAGLPEVDEARRRLRR